MRGVRLPLVLSIAAALAACATPSREPSGGAALRVCPGFVSNAPQTDAQRRITSYAPYVKVAGVTLARAPVEGCVSSGFGPRRGGAGRFHHGLDIFTRSPAPIRAGADGVVEQVETVRGYGRTVVIRHNRRLATRYAHLSSYAQGLRPGARVRQGDVIGRTGDSGNATAVHLHYEILVNGKAQNPLTVGR